MLSKSRLRNESERVIMGQTEDKLVFANPGGFGLLDKLEQMEKKIEVLISKDEKNTGQIKGHQKNIDEHQKNIDEHQKKITLLNRQVGRLIETSESYLSVRRRFLDVYQRDVKGIEKFQGSKAIREGNARAHEGDAFGDAVLFDHDRCLDQNIYRELYGLTHEQVLDFYSGAGADDGGLFLVLNAHATMLAQGKIPSDDLKAAFVSFLDKVKEYWPEPPNKEPTTSLGCAYYTFWKKFNE